MNNLGQFRRSIVVVEIGRQVLFAAFPLALAYAAASDLLTMTIANKLVAAMIVAFAVCLPLIGMSWNEIAMHLAAGAVVIAFAFAFFAAGWIGGGDAKFAAVVALWLGWDHLIDFSVYASLFGGALTLLVLSFRRSVLPAFVIRQPWLQRLHDENAGVPYGVALAAAGLATYPDTIWMRLATG
jgi:prepilin peptidase CpaA